METTRIGAKGQVSIPRTVMRRLGLEPGTPLIVETGEDGAIVLGPAGVCPIELYDDARVAELLEEDRIAPEESEAVERALRDAGGSRPPDPATLGPEAASAAAR